MKRYKVVVLLLLMVVGYASINTSLELLGETNLAYNEKDFRIEISKVKINEEERNETISKDKQEFIVSESGSISYTVTNYSYQYDAVVNLVCEPSDDVEIEQIGVLDAQSKKESIVVNKKEESITCRIEIEKVSRTEYAKSMCPYEVGKEWTHSYTGSEQEFIVPCDGEYKFELWGASGEPEKGLANSYGRGGYTSGILYVLREEKLYLKVGGSNAFNGGGIAEACGGGASDIRIIGGDTFESLKSRIMVAAGGGGSIHIAGSSLISRGDAGGLNGISANTYFEPGVVSGEYHSSGFSGGGATQTRGGVTGSYGRDPYVVSMDGAFGQGGYYNFRSSGGGGGYYGGGHGRHPGSSWSGGGGGSSFISGHNGCNAIDYASTQNNIIHTGKPEHYSGYVFKNTQMKAGNEAMPTYNGLSSMVGNSGNGYAKITYLG